MNVLALFLLCSLLLAGCRGQGFQGHVYQREADGGIGPIIAGAEILFSPEGGGAGSLARSNAAGFYKRPLGTGRYLVTATHLAYQDYSSAPGFFVVTGDGFQTGNIFLHRRAATIILLVRHAERASADPNTNLSDAGLARAEDLAQIAEETGVSATFATEFCRTAQTAQPAATQLGLVIQVQPNTQAGNQLANCDPPISAATELLLTDLADHILEENSSQVVLVVGHSNTVPEIAVQLGADPLCPVFLPFDPNNDCQIPEGEFNHLFAVIVPDDGSPGEVIHKLYGE